MLVFVIKNLFSNPAGLKSTLIGIAAFAAVIVISYVLASGKETPLKDGEVLSEAASKWVETGIYAFYIMAIIAIGAMVFSGVKN